MCGDTLELSDAAVGGVKKNSTLAVEDSSLFGFTFTSLYTIRPELCTLLKRRSKSLFQEIFGSVPDDEDDEATDA